MGDAYTKTLPTEPGWYWIRHGDTDPKVMNLVYYPYGEWRMAHYSYGDNVPFVSIPNNLQIGPRIPSPEDIVELQNDHRRLEHMLGECPMEPWTERSEIDADMARMGVK